MRELRFLGYYLSIVLIAEVAFLWLLEHAVPFGWWICGIALVINVFSVLPGLLTPTRGETPQ